MDENYLKIWIALIAELVERIWIPKMSRTRIFYQCRTRDFFFFNKSVKLGFATQKQIHKIMNRNDFILIRTKYIQSIPPNRWKGGQVLSNLSFKSSLSQVHLLFQNSIIRNPKLHQEPYFTSPQVVTKNASQS